jgi:hypothetical protein
VPEPTAGGAANAGAWVTLLTRLTGQLATGSEAPGRTSARPLEGAGTPAGGDPEVGRIGSG